MSQESKEQEFERIIGPDAGGFGTEKAVLALVGLFMGTLGTIVIISLVFFAS